MISNKSTIMQEYGKRAFKCYNACITENIRNERWKYYSQLNRCVSVYVRGIKEIIVGSLVEK